MGSPLAQGFQAPFPDRRMPAAVMETVGSLLSVQRRCGVAAQLSGRCVLELLTKCGYVHHS